MWRPDTLRPVSVHPSTTQLQVVDQALFWRRNAAIARSISDGHNSAKSCTWWEEKIRFRNAKFCFENHMVANV